MFLIMIIEDTEKDSLRLQKMITKNNIDATFVVYSNGEDALDYLKTTGKTIDMFFIDIVFPTIDGYQIASLIRNKEEYITTPIIFVTGYDGNPLNAFQEYHCYSYIQKPFCEAELQKQLLPLLRATDNNKKARISQMERRISLNTRKGVSLVRVRDILSLEVDGKDLIVYTEKATHIIPRKTLDSLLKELNEPSIIKCHKSFAVNTEKLSGVVKKKRDLWQPINKATGKEFNCLISKTYYDEVMAKSMMVEVIIND